MGTVLLVAGVPPGRGVFVLFLGVTYTTVGYGDLVLPQEWRLIGSVEGLTGILMCGLSSGLFFAVVSRVFAVRSAARQGDP